jgi:hypothetical protein
MLHEGALSTAAMQDEATDTSQLLQTLTED